MCEGLSQGTFPSLPSAQEMEVGRLLRPPSIDAGGTFRRRSTLDHCLIEEGTSFLHSWLFLGLVTTIFGPIVSVQAFIGENASGTAVITTRILPE